MQKVSFKYFAYYKLMKMSNLNIFRDISISESNFKLIYFCLLQFNWETFSFPHSPLMMFPLLYFNVHIYKKYQSLNVTIE